MSASLPRPCSVRINTAQFARSFETFVVQPALVLTPVQQPVVTSSKGEDDDVIELTDDSEEENRQPGSTNIISQVKQGVVGPTANLVYPKAGFIFGHLARNPRLNNVRRPDIHGDRADFCRWQKSGCHFLL